MKRDVDYVVQEDEVIIVDEFTGRLMTGRRYSDGLHQAIEAKEQLKVQNESMTLATITFQNYFRMYRKLAGMTGTAKTEEEEFKKIYGLEVIQVPTNRPMIRKDMPDVVYKTENGKFRAVVEEIVDVIRRTNRCLSVRYRLRTPRSLSEMLKKQRRYSIKYSMRSIMRKKRKSFRAQVNRFCYDCDEHGGPRYGYFAWRRRT